MWNQINTHIMMWLYFYTCKYTSIYRKKQIHQNIFNEKNKKIRKQKYNYIFITLCLNIFIYLFVCIFKILSAWSVLIKRILQK